MADQEDPTQGSPFDFSKSMGAMQDRFGALKGQWDSFLQDPAAQTATMQFAINMMQPPSFGDTGMARIGRALGSAGEAVDRRAEAERKQQESEANIELKGARAEAAQSRADVNRMRDDLGRERLKAQDLFNLRNGYMKYRHDEMSAYKERVREWQKRDEKSRDAISPGPPAGPMPEPPALMTLQQFKDYQETGILPTPGVMQRPSGGASVSPGDARAEVGAPAGTTTKRHVVVNPDTGAELEWDPSRKTWVPVGKEAPAATAQPERKYEEY
jgi:hypothetical protein